VGNSSPVFRVVRVWLISLEGLCHPNLLLFISVFRV